MSMPPSFYEPVEGLGPVDTSRVWELPKSGPEHTVMLRRCLATAGKAEAELSMQWGLQVVVDEVAILFSGPEQLYKFYESIHRDHAWHVFNTVEDSGLINSTGAEQPATYSAGYVFVRHPATHVRLELMTLRSGYSPVHGPMLPDTTDKGPVIVHASWKASTLNQYLSQVRQLRDQAIQVGWEFVSDYGRFAYVGGKRPYLKPRVNLRDQG